MTPNFTELLVQDTSNSQEFISAVESIKTYSSWITGISNTGNSKLDGFLTTAKTNDGQWYNTIYPLYLNMPATILAKGGGIDSDLSLLITLNGQLTSGDNTKVLASISQYATTLSKTLNELRSTTSALGKDLLQYAKELTSDTNNFMSGVAIINADIEAKRVEISKNKATLNSLQHASSKDNNKIKAVEQQIESLVAAVNKDTTDSAEFSRGAQLLKTAINASTFLGTYWSNLATGITKSILELKGITSQPAAIMKLDLTENQKNWQSIKADYEKIDQTIK